MSITRPTDNAAAFRRVHEVTNTHDATLIAATFDEDVAQPLMTVVADETRSALAGAGRTPRVVGDAELLRRLAFTEGCRYNRCGGFTGSN